MNKFSVTKFSCICITLFVLFNLGCKSKTQNNHNKLLQDYYTVSISSLNQKLYNNIDSNSIFWGYLNSINLLSDSLQDNPESELSVEVYSLHTKAFTEKFNYYKSQQIIDAMIQTIIDCGFQKNLKVKLIQYHLLSDILWIYSKDLFEGNVACVLTQVENENEITQNDSISLLVTLSVSSHKDWKKEYFVVCESDTFYPSGAFQRIVINKKPKGKGIENIKGKLIYDGFEKIEFPFERDVIVK